MEGRDESSYRRTVEPEEKEEEEESTEEEIEKYKIITKKGGEQGKVFCPVMEVEVRYRTRHGNGETLSVGAEERLES